MTMPMTAPVKSAEVPAGEFKAKCLAMLDEVRDEGKSFIITKRGVPVAKLVPIGTPDASTRKVHYFGSLKHLVESVDADIFSTGESWEADA